MSDIEDYLTFKYYDPDDDGFEELERVSFNDKGKKMVLTYLSYFMDTYDHITCQPCECHMHHEDYDIHISFDLMVTEVGVYLNVTCPICGSSKNIDIWFIMQIYEKLMNDANLNIEDTRPRYENNIIKFPKRD